MRRETAPVRRSGMSWTVARNSWRWTKRMRAMPSRFTLARSRGHGVPQDIEQCRGDIQMKPLMGMERLGVITGALQIMKQRWPTLSSATQTGWNVPKYLRAARRIHRTTEGTPNVQRISATRMALTPASCQNALLFRP